jgi:hypothetical protein
MGIEHRKSVADNLGAPPVPSRVGVCSIESE